MSRRCAVLVFVCGMSATPAAAQTQTTAEAVPSFVQLFTGLAGDFVHLGTVHTAVVLGAGGALALAVWPHDVALTRNAVSWTTTEEVLDPGEVIGSGLMQVGGAFAVYTIGRVAHNPRFATVGAELVRAQLLNGGITQGVKVAVGRRRPDSGSDSFPSGHASASFATATIIHREFGWKAGLAAYAAASYVATSRLSENSHYGSDVIFGAAIGMASGHAVRLGHGRTTVSLSPLAQPGARGVELVWLQR
jgi:membrane-associated phospholipid phosphatase